MESATAAQVAGEGMPSAEGGEDEVDSEPLGLDVPRVLGRVEGRLPGPSLICIGGVHGNEPAGVLALGRVVETLTSRAGLMRGRFAALSGNRTALREGMRFIDKDLNRAWTRDRVRTMPSWVGNGASGAAQSGRELDVEDVEQLELARAIDEVVRGSDERVFVLDLHTTSGPGGAFSTAADKLANRAFALSFPSPLILGLEELVEGTLIDYLGERGFVAAVFESGQHGEPDAVIRAEAAIWIALAASGVLRESDLPEFRPSRERLLGEAKMLPRVMEMRYRHPVEEDTDFEMRPGFRNFQCVEEGRLVADDSSGPIAVPETGRMLMPLYQVQGHDGFFIVREFGVFWLRLSKFLRKLRLQSVVHFLPGIRRSPHDPESLLVNRRIARLYPLQILHLLGFRRVFDDGRFLEVRRRSHDTPQG